MKRYPHPLRFVIAVFDAPIGKCVTLYFRYRFHKEPLQVIAWVFIGTSKFLTTVTQARERLYLLDPSILENMTEPQTVIHFPQELYGVSEWGMGTISESYLEWGVDGVLVAWAYILYRSQLYKGNLWYLTGSGASEIESEARAKTRRWILNFGLPLPLCKPFDPIREI
jgi:hypothetical protein